MSVLLPAAACLVAAVAAVIYLRLWSYPLFSLSHHHPHGPLRDVHPTAKPGGGRSKERRRRGKDPMKELFKAAKKSGSSVNALLNTKQLPGNTNDDEQEQDEHQLPASASPVVVDPESEPAAATIQLPSNTAHSTVHTPPPSHITNDNHLVEPAVTDTDDPQEEQTSAFGQSSSQDATPTNDQPSQLQQPDPSVVLYDSDANEAPESAAHVAPSAQAAPLESAAPASAGPCHDCSEMSDMIKYERERWREHEGELNSQIQSLSSQLQALHQHQQQLQLQFQQQQQQQQLSQPVSPYGYSYPYQPYGFPYDNNRAGPSRHMIITDPPPSASSSRSRRKSSTATAASADSQSSSAAVPPPATTAPAVWYPNSHIQQAGHQVHPTAGTSSIDNWVHAHALPSSSPAVDAHYDPSSPQSSSIASVSPPPSLTLSSSSELSPADEDLALSPLVTENTSIDQSITNIMNKRGRKRTRMGSGALPSTDAESDVLSHNWLGINPSAYPTELALGLGIGMGFNGSGNSSKARWQKRGASGSSTGNVPSDGEESAPHTDPSVDSDHPESEAESRSSTDSPPTEDDPAAAATAEEQGGEEESSIPGLAELIFKRPDTLGIRTSSKSLSRSRSNLALGSVAAAILSPPTVVSQETPQPATETPDVAGNTVVVVAAAGTPDSVPGPSRPKQQRSNKSNKKNNASRASKESSSQQKTIPALNTMAPRYTAPAVNGGHVNGFFSPSVYHNYPHPYPASIQSHLHPHLHLDSQRSHSPSPSQSTSSSMVSSPTSAGSGAYFPGSPGALGFGYGFGHFPIPMPSPQPGYFAYPMYQTPQPPMGVYPTINGHEIPSNGESVEEVLEDETPTEQSESDAAAAPVARQAQDTSSLETEEEELVFPSLFPAGSGLVSPAAAA